MKPFFLSPAMFAVAALVSAPAAASPLSGPRGEADYWEHQAQPVSQRTRAEVMAEFYRDRTRVALHGDASYPPVALAVASTATRAEVQQAWQRAARDGQLPLTAEVSDASPAELAQRAPAELLVASYAEPPAQAVTAMPLQATLPQPAPPLPQEPAPTHAEALPPSLPPEQRPPHAATPELALDEGEELVSEATGALRQ